MASILVTDDAAFMRKVLRCIFEEMGHVIDEASDGKECLSKVKNTDYDLITMDITMPEMDGISAVKAIKKIKPDQKIIMVSAIGQQAMVIEAIQAGACDFLVKPFQKENVIKSVDKVLNNGT